MAAYRRDLQRWQDFLYLRGITDITQVIPLLVSDFTTLAGEGFGPYPPLAPASVNRALAAVRALHKFAYRRGIISTNPAAQITSVSQGKHLPQVLSVEQIERLFTATGGQEEILTLRDRALLEFLYATGARISEAVGLDIDDLDLTAAFPVVRLAGKGRKERLVPLGSYAKDALQVYLVRSRPALAKKKSEKKVVRRSSSAVFLNTLGRPLSRQSAWALLQRAGARAGIGEQISPHTLRHCFATHLLSGGADVRVVQELLGHSSVTTTQIYTKVSIDQLREVYAGSHPRAQNH